jgi:hypothetical protein
MSRAICVVPGFRRDEKVAALADNHEPPASRVPGSPQHSINEFGRAKHGNSGFFGQSEWAHSVNRNSLDGMFCIHSILP